MRRPLLWVLAGFLLLFFALIDFYWNGAVQVVEGAGLLPDVIRGVVTDAQGPVAGAIVQVQGTPHQTSTSAEGVFTFKGLRGRPPITLTAWADGYYIGWASLDPQAEGYAPGEPLAITLKPLYTSDNTHYEWFSFDGVEGSASCGLCHREYDEWLQDAHSQAAVNPRFISIYQGTDVAGNESQPMRWDREGQALPPDPNLPYYGPGFRLDQPQRAGNCATCHTPLASKIPNITNCGWSGCHTDLTAERADQVDTGVIPLYLTGDAAEGISCDFCHKISEVFLDPETGLPYPDKPGILSMRLSRPDEGQQLFFGTLVDVTRRVTYSPLYSESAYCASCHYGVFGGVVGHNTVSGGVTIYNSYGEWLESPYSDPESGQTCQDCHMPVLDVNFFVFPDKGGIRRDYAEFHDHRMPGAYDETLLKNSVTMAAEATSQDGRLQVRVSITNDQTGHHIPTDVPTRQMILVVEALSPDSEPLPLVEGPVMPEWAGNFASQAGKIYAKTLKDEWTGEVPTAAYWRPVTILEDTRLAALATDTAHFVFDLSADDKATVRVRLFFRRTFQVLAEQKGWDDPDILMEEATIHVGK